MQFDIPLARFCRGRTTFFARTLGPIFRLAKKKVPQFKPLCAKKHVRYMNAANALRLNRATQTPPNYGASFAVPFLVSFGIARGMHVRRSIFLEVSVWATKSDPLILYALVVWEPFDFVYPREMGYRGHNSMGPIRHASVGGIWQAARQVPRLCLHGPRVVVFLKRHLLRGRHPGI